jgi:hypothetical protein
MAHRTRDTVAIYTELPRELAVRLRAFAKRDRRSLRAEVARAVELLLAAEDVPPVHASERGPGKVG